LGEAVPWASRLAAIEISVRKARRDLGRWFILNLQPT